MLSEVSVTALVWEVEISIFWSVTEKKCSCHTDGSNKVAVGVNRTTSTRNTVLGEKRGTKSKHINLLTYRHELV